MHVSIRITNATLTTSRRRRGSGTRLLLVAPVFTIVCFALSPQARAVCQQGCGTPGQEDTVLGEDALLNDTDGSQNTAVGSSALYSNKYGGGNTANGVSALRSNVLGFYNTAIGGYALNGNTNGSSNTAVGSYALNSNDGADNTATGYFALGANTSGISNTAAGFKALFSNTTGSNNTAVGNNALSGSLAGNTGSNNTANGVNALFRNSTGSNNTANGLSALGNNTTGVGNLALGSTALFRNTTGRFNTAVGAFAGSKLTTGSNNIDIGNVGVAGEANTIRIGTGETQTTTFIAGISGATVAGGVGVIVDSSGHLGTVTSSERFKDAIKPMDKASEAILSLKPITFHYKKELDPESIPQFGLVAEDVAKVNPDLVARDDQGKPYTVRYEAVNAMLLNEFLKEHRKVEEQARTNHEQDATITVLKSTVAQQQKDIASLTAALKAQAAQIQEVSDQLKTQAPTRRVVAND